MQHCIFSRGYLLVKMASKTVIIVIIRFSALLPITPPPPPFRISPPFQCFFFFLSKSAPILILYKSTGAYQPRFILNSSQTKGNVTLQKQWSMPMVLCPCECINSSNEWSLLQILWRSLGWSWGRIQGPQVRFPVSLIHSPWLALCSHCRLF